MFSRISFAKTANMPIDQVTISFLDPYQSSGPLVISPRFDDSLSFLTQWLTAHRSYVESQMLLHGAVLIRGFQINDAPDFEKAIMALQPNLSDSYRGTSPRSVFAGTKYTFSAADVPVNYPIAQHLEMSFLKAPPRELYFGCLKESSSKGGETSLCDFRKVYRDLDPDLRRKFQDKKILYRRQHGKVGERWTFDVGAMLPWTQLFGTSSRAEVEKIAREEESPPVQWVGPNQDTFLQEWKDEPCQYHPITNECVWFNHAQVFHWSTFPAELWYAFTRLNDIRFLIRCIIMWIIAIIKYGLLGYKMALNMSFGDGTPISLREMNLVRKVIHDNMVFNTWEKGDIMCIDNFSTSHGRQPTYDFGRKILVAWSNPYDKTLTKAPSSSEQVTLVDCSCEEMKQLKSAVRNIIKTNDSTVPNAVQATPDTTPDSTLSSEEAEDLKAMYENHHKSQENLQLPSLGCHKRHTSGPIPQFS
mmetsp:Transcript_17556/g.36884  ORF Transcript_17556/g.36884 Transcript_17556/m.36884 type:complete len:473 (+) Transcript_17556:117-1535(+)